jgi:hypothetical protein
LQRHAKFRTRTNVALDGNRTAVNVHDPTRALRYAISLSVGGFEIVSSASIVLDTVH